MDIMIEITEVITVETWKERAEHIMNGREDSTVEMIDREESTVEKEFMQMEVAIVMKAVGDIMSTMIDQEMIVTIAVEDMVMVMNIMTGTGVIIIEINIMMDMILDTRKRDKFMMTETDPGMMTEEMLTRVTKMTERREDMMKNMYTEMTRKMRNMLTEMIRERRDMVTKTENMKIHADMTTDMIIESISITIEKMIEDTEMKADIMKMILFTMITLISLNMFPTMNKRESCLQSMFLTCPEIRGVQPSTILLDPGT